MFSPLTLFVTKYGRSNLRYNFGVARTCYEARVKFPPCDGRKRFVHECEVEALREVDNQFIAVVPKNKASEASCGSQKGDWKLYFALVSQMVHFDLPDWVEIIEFCVSKSEEDAREEIAKRLSIDDPYDIENIKIGEVIVDGYSIIPCRVKEYNLPALRPYKALERWNKRRALEEATRKCDCGSLDAALKYKLNQDEKGFKFDEFSVLDVGCGPLANIWVAVEEKGYIPASNVFGVDIDKYALFAGKCVYGEQLAEYGFDWDRQIFCCSAFTMPFESSTFDFIVAISSLENIVNSTEGVKTEKIDKGLGKGDRDQRAKEFVHKLETLLKPGGSLYLSTFKGEEGHMWSFSESALKSFFEGSSFHIDWVKSYPYPKTDENMAPTGVTHQIISLLAHI